MNTKDECYSIVFSTPLLSLKDTSRALRLDFGARWRVECPDEESRRGWKEVEVFAAQCIELRIQLGWRGVIITESLVDKFGLVIAKAKIWHQFNFHAEYDLHGKDHAHPCSVLIRLRRTPSAPQPTIPEDLPMAQFTALTMELDFSTYYSRIVLQTAIPSIAAMAPLVDAALRSLIADKLAKRAPMVFARGCLKRVANHSQHFEELGRTLFRVTARTNDRDLKKAFETLVTDADQDEPWKRIQLPLWKYTTHRLCTTPVKRDIHEITLETHDEDLSSDEMEAEDIFMDDSNSEDPDSEDDVFHFGSDDWIDDDGQHRHPIRNTCDRTNIQEDARQLDRRICDGNFEGSWPDKDDEDEFPFGELDTPQTAYIPTLSQSVSAPATQFFVFSDEENEPYGPSFQPLKKRPRLSPSSKAYWGAQALIQRHPLDELKNTTFDEAIDEAEFAFSDAEVDEIHDEDDIISELNE